MKSHEPRATNREPRTASREPRAASQLLPALTAAQLAEIARQAEAGYPDEICGMVIGKRGAPETYQVRPVRNLANKEPQRDPAGVERDARTAYFGDAREMLRISTEADAHGWETIILYHSHPDHDAYFSAMDRERALWPGQDPPEPLWPGVSYLVVSVRKGRACQARYHVWDQALQDFVEIPVSLPGASGGECLGSDRGGNR
ncbi:MAG TPA: M67 family metallopeptidase [Candidatus Methylomirabilis sp.]|nr:M67 family metallopeptidase [Candidatus Methylomirabilis sp.]